MSPRSPRARCHVNIPLVVHFLSSESSSTRRSRCGRDQHVAFVSLRHHLPLSMLELVELVHTRGHISVYTPAPDLVTALGNTTSIFIDFFSLLLAPRVPFGITTSHRCIVLRERELHLWFMVPVHRLTARSYSLSPHSVL
jgi:hypothetical protein